MRIGQPYQENGGFLTPRASSLVKFTKHVRPVCLPCMKSSCLTSQLLDKGILSGTESRTERCKKEGKTVLNKVFIIKFYGFYDYPAFSDTIPMWFKGIAPGLLKRVCVCVCVYSIWLLPRNGSVLCRNRRDNLNTTLLTRIIVHMQS